MRRLLLVLLCLLGSGTACAGPAPVASAAYQWKSVKVGGGGFMPNLIFSRAEKGLAYLRSDMGGIYRWDAARRIWIPLQDGMAESSFQGIEGLAPDPVDPNVVYAAVGMYRREPSAIIRSADRGRSWTVTPVPFRMGGNEDGRGVGERLAVDPNDTSVLFFGSRHDGLWRSPDKGRTWGKVAGFPLPGLGVPPQGQKTHAGVGFVVFDPASGRPGAGSRTLFAGVADPGAEHLFRSDDGGASWRAVPGGPRPELLPVRAELDSDGVLFIAYANGVGPNGVTDGAVFKLDTRTGQWTDITPDKRPDRPKGGYMGLSLDRQHAGTLVVATLNRWKPDGDTIWRSTDGGRSWRDFASGARRDVAASPFLLWGETQARLGWWMAGLAIDPFDSDHVAYTTGATVYASTDFTGLDRGRPTLWTPWVEGIEQTAVLTLTSPPQGPQLFSGFGDISGFAHERLDVSPPIFSHPVFDNTNTIDFAGLKPNVVVRSGTPHDGGPTLAWSQDSGRSWSPLAAPRPADMPPLPASDDPRAKRVDPYRDAAIIVSADGARLMVMTPTPVITDDRGASWREVSGLLAYGRPVADRADPKRFYALDFEHGRVQASTDGGESFTALSTTGLPTGIQIDRPGWREHPWPLIATPGRIGELWFVSRQGLYRSDDGGRSFRRIGSDVSVLALSFGKAPPGRRHPALFAIGKKGDLLAIWRSDDEGKSWLQINDAAHEWGRRFHAISGDPRVFGRVYVGTDGRGILYGELRR